jgi:hypothetical protein
MGAPGSVDADQHVLGRPAAVVGELGRGVAQHGEVVGDGVGPGVAPPQQDRQRLPGAGRSVVEERTQRMEAETRA